MMLCHSDALTQPIIDPRPELNYRTVNGKLRFIWESLPEREHYKLVLRNHSQLCQIAHRVEDMFNIIPDDVVYNDWPVSWLTGLPFCYISTGCTMVKSTLTDCPAEKVVRETWDLIEKEKCTIASLQPSMIQMLSSHCEDIPEPHWKLKVLSTTGFVRQSVMDAIGPCTDAIVTCYSLIEAGVVSRLMVTDTTKTRYTEGCVGDLTDPVRTRFDTEGPGSAKPTKIGEILLQGKLVCKEYFNDPNLTKMTFTEEGYLLTGDLGFYNEHNQLFVLGRKVDAIIRGETAIFPRDIEEKVNQCPGIWKVKVVSIKDYKNVVQMCACVIPRKDDSVTIERVKEFCRYQLGGTYDDDDNPHMPTYVFFFEEFPMHKGRVNRRMLAYMASEIVHGNVACEF
ncbi:putative acyl-CoA synthetase YngI [Physella acuta]|uniref:putative acyl-CoA synthetase YngI n=1 Tax=Physella acuta TaxID=109671 RepID=UPI0027DD9B5E|nr:putative acyl-CoA synthetase YngI [Physella acuta]